MKATIEIPDELYRRVKAKSALDGRTVRDVTVQLFRQWVAETESEAAAVAAAAAESARTKPGWFGGLRAYASHAAGHHDMDTIRKSIARGRGRTRRTAADDTET